MYRFDCGSGLGVVKSEETVILNQWNTLSVYRHRWDAWIQLNRGKRISGRSKVSQFYTFSNGTQNPKDVIEIFIISPASTPIHFENGIIFWICFTNKNFTLTNLIYN